MALSIPAQRLLPRHNLLIPFGVPLLAILLGGGALLTIGFQEQSLLATTTIALLLGAIGLVWLLMEDGWSSEQLTLQQLFWVTFGLRIFVAAILHGVLKQTYGDALPYWQYGSEGGDERRFYENAARFATAWQNGTILREEPHWSEVTYLSWLHIVAFVRFLGESLGGDTIFNIKLIVCFCSALIVPYTYKIALRLFNARIAMLAATFSFWLPDYWYMASTVMRDMLICCLIVIIFCQVIELRFTRFQLWRVILVLLLNFIVLHNLRSQLSFTLAGMILLIASVSLFRYFYIVGPLCIVGILSLFLVSPQMLSAISGTGSQGLDYRTSAYVDATIEKADDDSLGRSVQQLPIVIRGPVAATQLMLLPIPPWGPLQDSGFGRGFEPRGIVEAIAGLIWFFVFVPLLPIGVLEILNRYPLSKTIWVLGTAILFALILGISGGILVRWRLMFMPFLIILIAHGYQARHQHHAVRLLTTEALLAILVAYITLKYVI